MVNASTGGWDPHYASSGHECLDSIAFSVPPSTILFAAPHRDIVAFQHPASTVGTNVHIEMTVERHDLLNMALNGGGVCERMEGRRSSRYPVRRHALAFVPAGCERRLNVSGPVSTLTVSLPVGLLARFGEGLPDVSRDAFHDYDNPRLAQLVQMLARELGTPGFASDILIDGLVRAINALMVQRSGGPSIDVPDRIHIAPVHLARVLNHIEGNLGRTIALADLAQIAGLSVFHFSRVFKRQTGTTPYQAVNSARLAYARLLLKSGHMPLAQIALACGFSSQAHFSTAFAKQLGMPPGRYRRAVMH